MFRSIKTKIIVLQVGLVLSVAVSLGIISYLITFSSLRDSQQQNLEYLAMNIGVEISAEITNKKDLLEKISNTEAVTNFPVKQQDSELAEYFSKYTREFPVLSYVNEKGMEELKVVYGRTTAELSDINNTAIFTSAIANPNKVFSSYSAFSPEINGPSIEFGFLSKNFFDEFVGFISGKIPVSVLTKNIQAFNSAQSTALLFDSAGTILACQDRDKVLKKVVIKGTDSESVIAEMKAMKPGFGRAVISGIDGYIAYSPVPGLNWVVVTVLPYQQFVAKLYALRNSMILVGLTILMAGTALSLFLATDMTQPILELVERTALIAKGDFSQRVDIKSKDEIGTLAESFNSMTENLQKTTTSMVNLDREIVDRKKAEHALHDSNKELKATVERLTIANRELSEFAHVAAHDLKAPLRAIGSLAGLLSVDYGDKLDEQGRRYLDMLVRRTERISELISGILRYSEVGYESEKQQVNLNDIIDEVIAETVPPKNIEIIKENNFPTILCNRVHIIQVFQNLISNAIKFMDKPRGYVRLNCVEEGDFWKFRVADNGCGIEQKYFKKIFKVFQTLTRRDEMESTGIGLSVVRRIIEKYDGKIWVESEPGKGSTFYFALPKQELEVKNEKLQVNTVS
ncbi:MAG: ATP-binding protein [Sedimentisphaerales bacterium]|jgi:signal transduction histidine kinase